MVNGSSERKNNSIEEVNEKLIMQKEIYKKK